MRDKYNLFKKSKISGKKIWKIALLFILFFVIILFFKISNNKNFIFFNKQGGSAAVFDKLLNDKNYLELIKKLNEELKKTPFKLNYLIYRGYSYFLLGEDENDLEKKNNYLRLSLIDLRRALAIGNIDKNIGNVYFCLGKTYYYFGEASYHQSLIYFGKSYASGNRRKDLLYMLGILNSFIGNYKAAVEKYLESLKYDESELVLLALSTAYYNDNDSENAKKNLFKLINISNNLEIKEKSYFLIGEILFNEKKINEAMDYFNKVIDLNENNSFAYFYRGEIFYLQNKKAEARSNWRKTLELNPGNIKAKKRIYNY